MVKRLRIPHTVPISDPQHPEVLLYIHASQSYYLHYCKHSQEMKYINLVLIQKPYQKYIPALLHVTDILTDSCQIQDFSIVP